jgi:hypothetical protein
MASALNITNTTESSSKDTGCLVLEGGLGVEKKATFGGGINGTTTNDSAAAGCVGEYVSSSVASGSAVSLTTGNVTQVTSISLTAGDWDLYGTVAFAPDGTTTLTNIVGGISNSSSNFSDDYSRFDTPLGGITSSINPRASVPTVRVSIATTTTYYLIAYSVFGVSTNKAWGKLQARRVR